MATSVAWPESQTSDERRSRGTSSSSRGGTFGRCDGQEGSLGHYGLPRMSRGMLGLSPHPGIHLGILRRAFGCDATLGRASAVKGGEDLRIVRTKQGADAIALSEHPFLK